MRLEMWHVLHQCIKDGIQPLYCIDILLLVHTAIKDLDLELTWTWLLLWA